MMILSKTIGKRPNEKTENYVGPQAEAWNFKKEKIVKHWKLENHGNKHQHRDDGNGSVTMFTSHVSLMNNK